MEENEDRKHAFILSLNAFPEELRISRFFPTAFYIDCANCMEGSFGLVFQ